MITVILYNSDCEMCIKKLYIFWSGCNLEGLVRIFTPGGNKNCTKSRFERQGVEEKKKKFPSGIYRIDTGKNNCLFSTVSGLEKAFSTVCVVIRFGQ